MFLSPTIKNNNDQFLGNNIHVMNPLLIKLNSIVFKCYYNLKKLKYT